MNSSIKTPILIVGSGLAGLTLALKLAKDDFKVSMLAKRSIDSGSTSWAQGGIAAVLSDEDSFESHIEDTLIAGGGLCRQETVDFVVKNGPRSIEWLIGIKLFLMV